MESSSLVNFMCKLCFKEHPPWEVCKVEDLQMDQKTREIMKQDLIMKQKMETVNHPAHYGGDTTYEHWKVMVAWGLLSNAFLYNCTKYICRMGKKSNALEDLKKAKWYLEKAIEQLETQSPTNHA